jgi:hypothetical protein
VFTPSSPLRAAGLSNGVNPTQGLWRWITSLSFQIKKEDMMKRFIYITVVLMLMLIFIGCFATMTSEERKETYDLRKGVGNSQFVGDSSPEARNQAQSLIRLSGY